MELVRWDKIKSEIAECQDIIKLTKLSYSLDAVQKWSKQSGQSLETQNEIAEYRLRLDRKRGQWVEENISKEGGESGGRPPNNPAQNGGVIPTLTEAGIGHHESPKIDWLFKYSDGKYYCVESKSRELYKPPPFWGTGLDIIQLNLRMQLLMDLEIDTILLVFEKNTDNIYWQFLSTLEEGRYIDTKNKIRIYDIDSFMKEEKP